MRISRRRKGFFSLILTCILVLTSTNSVFAADKTFIEKVKNEFLSYEAKITKKHKTYKQDEQKKMEDYRSKENKALDRFAAQTKEDSIKLEKLLKQDVQKIKSQYGKNNDYDAKIREYENSINRFHSGSSMNEYDTSINQYHSNSLMNNYADATNKYHSGSPMLKYGDAVNQYSSGSPMRKYYDTVNRYHSDGPMWRLYNGSNQYDSNGIMNKYRFGKISKQEAAKQWKALLQKEDQNIQQSVKQTNESLQQIINTAKTDILKQKYETVNGILAQRAKSLQTISEMRTQYFGEGISFEPLIPDLGETNVMLNGEWLAFEQPPVILNGTTLVPMRAIFEKLEAEVKWHAKTNTITASKQSINISLTLDKKTATINGKTVTLEAPPKLINGHTMVPLRFVSEALGAEVKWDGANNTIFIIPN